MVDKGSNTECSEKKPTNKKIVLYLKIGYGSQDKKPGIFIEGGIHARYLYVHFHKKNIINTYLHNFMH